jgi:hypothetical protein
LMDFWLRILRRCCCCCRHVTLTWNIRSL